MKYITRNFAITKLNVLCLNTETCEPFNKDITLNCEIKDDSDLMEAAREIIDNEEDRAVRIVSKETEYVLLGMTLNDFIAHAVKLDKTTRKPIEE